MDAHAKYPRRLFHAGRLVPKRQRREPRACHLDNHVGPLLDTERYDAFADANAGDEIAQYWRGLGTCAHCGSTISRDQIRPRAAA